MERYTNSPLPTKFNTLKFTGKVMACFMDICHTNLCIVLGGQCYNKFPVLLQSPDNESEGSIQGGWGDLEKVRNSSS